MSWEALNQLIAASGCFSGATVAGWSVDPIVVAPLLLAIGLYATGLVRLWRSAGVGRGASLLETGAFVCGWLVMALALLSPLHELSRQLFSAHMAEHELVMVVAAPLLAASRPLGVLVWAFPRGWRARVARATQTLGYLTFFGPLTRPLVATAVHGAAIWFWHIPPLFDAALGNEALHWVQHLTFVLSALYFWWALLGPRRRPAAAVVCLFVTGLHTAALGVLLTLAPRPLYAMQAKLAAAYGADPMADQQLAGLIMWVPAGLVYVVGGLVLAGLWISRSAGSDREGAHVGQL